MKYVNNYVSAVSLVRCKHSAVLQSKSPNRKHVKYKNAWLSHTCLCSSSNLISTHLRHVPYRCILSPYLKPSWTPSLNAWRSGSTTFALLIHGQNTLAPHVFSAQTISTSATWEKQTSAVAFMPLYSTGFYSISYSITVILTACTIPLLYLVLDPEDYSPKWMVLILTAFESVFDCSLFDALVSIRIFFLSV